MNFERAVEIEKVDAEQRVVWGWAYVCEDGGEQVVDHSGDVVDASEVQKAAHGFVGDARRGTLMHQDDAGQIVDSIFFSKAVQDALGIDLGRVGWFVGFRVDDDAAWQGVKDGRYSAFSIGGSADTEDISKAGNEDQPRDDRGRWSSGGAGGGSRGDADDDRQTGEADTRMSQLLRALDRAGRGGEDRARVTRLRRQVRELHSEISPRMREEFAERFRREGVDALGPRARARREEE